MATALSTFPTAIPRCFADDSPTLRKRGESGDEQALELNDVAAAAFEVLLESTRMVMTGKRGGGDKTLPSQMFEPNAADAHERRRMALKEAYRPEDTNRLMTDRLSRTSVQARRTLQARQAGDTLRHPW